MAKTGYQAVALDPAVADSLRAVAHYESIISGERVSMSDALAHLVQVWLHATKLPDYMRAAILNTAEDSKEAASGDAKR